MMKLFSLECKNIAKSFIRNENIFSDINFRLNPSEILGITGTNGAGKTTLLKMIAGVLSPSKGGIELKIDGKSIKKENFYEYFGYVAPYLNLYEEFTSLEHLKLMSQISNISFESTIAEKYLRIFNLYNIRNVAIRTFSSGMKQRLKYIHTLLKKPEILLLDEPMTNLDIDGIEIVKSLIDSHIIQGGGVIIASNDEREISLCGRTLSLNKEVI